jgi:hypothetical protein
MNRAVSNVNDEVEPGAPFWIGMWTLAFAPQHSFLVLCFTYVTFFYLHGTVEDVDLFTSTN